MAYSQQPHTKASADALPQGYTLNSYTIDRVLHEDEFSISYLASVNTSDADSHANEAEVILVEYFPRALSHRDPNTKTITLNSPSCHEEFEWGLLTYRNKAKNFVTINHPNIVNIKDCFKASDTVYVITDPIYEDTPQTYADSINNNERDRKDDSNTHERVNTAENWTTLLSYAQNNTQNNTQTNTPNKRLAESEILSFTTQILDALANIHSTGLILSDLTPSTILVQRKTGKVVISQLADPKHLFRHYNKAIAQHISPGYSACEQYYASDKLGAWTNIYAMGSILYRLISGTTPDSAAYRLTHLTDLHKDSLTPALQIKYKHIQGEGFSNYSDTLLKAIDHAMQLQSIDRPQSVQEWQETLGIETRSPATSDMTNNTANDTNSSAETMHLIIPGITNSSNDSIQVIKATDSSEIDFIALSQLPIEKGKPTRRINPVVGISAVLIASLLAVFYYFILPTAQPQPQFDSVTSAKEDFTIRPEALLEITSLAERVIEEKSYEESALIESALIESAFDENSLQQEVALTPLTPLWILDVPLVKNDLSTQEHPHYLVNSTIRSVVAKPPSTNDTTRLVSLASVIQADTALSLLTFSETTTTVATTEANDKELVTARQALMKARVIQTNRTTNMHALSLQKATLTKNKSTKTRQQYQQEWALKQRKKKKTNTKNRNKQAEKRPHQKTRKHYHNEWVAKQQQLKKRAAWKQKKRQLEIMKTRKTTSQIENQLLNENDW